MTLYACLHTLLIGSSAVLTSGLHSLNALPVCCRSLNVPSKLLDALDQHKAEHSREPLLIQLSTDQVSVLFDHHLNVHVSILFTLLVNLDIGGAYRSISCHPCRCGPVCQSLLALRLMHA